MAVNCTALPATLLESELFGHVKGAFTGASADRRGRFALAEMGTIFLDEIGDTSPDFQTKLLRVLQEQEYYPIGAERPEREAAPRPRDSPRAPARLRRSHHCLIFYCVNFDCVFDCSTFTLC